jgi:hypothetical protein
MADYNKRFLDGQYRNSKEKNKLINNIIKDFEQYQTILAELKASEQQRQALRNSIEYACNEKKENLLDKLLHDPEYLKLRNSTLEKKKIYKNIKLKYKIALIQRKNIYNNVGKNINEYKKSKSIIVLKSQYIGSIINRIQISIIFVSSTITLFESIQSNFVIPAFYLTIIPILLSTYIAIILAISRFYKFDTKKENIQKVEEKFSYIINRLRYKRRKCINFDFTCEKLTDWNILIENFNKDGLEEMITKTIEESDSLLTLKEYTYYYKVYNKIRTKFHVNHFNNELMNNWKEINISNNTEWKFGINTQKNDPGISQKRCCCIKFFRIFNCCRVETLDYDKFFSYLENNYNYSIENEDTCDEDSDDDDDDDDDENIDIVIQEKDDNSPVSKIMRGRSRSTSSMLLNNALDKQRSKLIKMEEVNEEDEKEQEDEDEYEDDISNNQLVRNKSFHRSVSLLGSSMKKRTDSTATDYQSEDEF